MKPFYRIKHLTHLLILLAGIIPSFSILAQYDPIIVDHQAVKQFDSIPESWIAKTKELTVHFAHTSHGSQIISGMEVIESLNPLYSFSRRVSAESEGLPPEETPPSLRMYDGNPPETYITPSDYWDGNEGIERTRMVVQSGRYSISMWSWCGEQSSNGADKVDQYLSSISQLEKEFPQTTFIYMTGHLDGGSSTLEQNNQRIREYVRQNGKVLFDFADIENFNLDGEFIPNASDACEWCADRCRDYPMECDFSCECSHSHKLNCLIKGKAFWVLLARLAGWESSNQPPIINPLENRRVQAGQTVSFTVNAMDPDGDELTYFISNNPQDSSFSDVTHEFSWTPSSGMNGTHEIIFTVRDSGNPPLSSKEAVKITVGEPDNSSGCFLSTLFN